MAVNNAKGAPMHMQRMVLIVASLLVFTSIAMVFFTMPSDIQFHRDADEGYYFRYAQYLSLHGLSSYPDMYRDHIAAKTNWIWPSPIRVGYFLIASTCMKVFGTTFTTLGFLSFFSYLALIFVSFVFCRRYFGTEIAALWSALIASAPVTMAMAKRALTDSLGNLFIMLSIWLFFAFLFDRRRLRTFILFMGVFTYSILIKEQFVVFLAIFFVVFIVYKYFYCKELKWGYGIALACIPPVIVSMVWILTCGKPADLLLLLKIQYMIPRVNLYSVYFLRGPWTVYIIDFLLISPAVTLLALGFLSHAAVHRRELREPKQVFFVLVLVLVYVVLVNIDYAKSVRYAFSMEALIAFAAILMLKVIVKPLKHAQAYLLSAVVALWLLNYVSFYNLFIRKNIYDPISIRLLEAHQMVR